MMVDKGTLLCMVLVMSHCMEQDGQPGFFPGGDRDGRNAQHLRKTVQVDLHAPLLHDIHHVQRQHNGFSQLNELESQVQVSLQTGGVHHIHDDIHLVA